MRTQSATLALAMLLGSVSAQTATTEAPKVHYVQCSALFTYCADQKDFGQGSECVKIKIVELPSNTEQSLAGWTNLVSYIQTTEKIKAGPQVGTEFSVCKSKDSLEAWKSISGDNNSSFDDEVTKAKISFKIQPQIPQVDMTKSEAEIKKELEIYNGLTEEQKEAKKKIMIDNIKELAKNDQLYKSLYENSEKTYNEAKKLYTEAAAQIDIQEQAKKLLIDDVKMLEQNEQKIKDTITDFRNKNPEIYNLDVESFDKIVKRVQDEQKKLMEGEGSANNGAATIAATAVAAAATALYLY